MFGRLGTVDGRNPALFFMDSLQFCSEILVVLVGGFNQSEISWSREESSTIF